jgi:uncharacterized damage-inducible protein DinB
MAAERSSTEVERIAEQLRRFYEGPSWLGPSLKEITRGIDEAAARRRVLPDAHTIWELVLHISAWFRIARERLSATRDLDPTPEEDWPLVTGTWEEAIASLAEEVDALEQAISAFQGERLQERAPAAEPQSFYDLLHGVIQHSAYHAGQIALLKKNLKSESAT